MQNKLVLNGFWLRLIAIITMVIDHIAMALEMSLVIENTSFIYLFLRIIGRLSFPLFALGIVEGVIHSKNTKLYLIRLLICLLTIASGIAIIEYAMKIAVQIDGNIFVDLLLGALIIYLLSFKNKWSFFVIPIIVVVGLLQIPSTPAFIRPSYNFYGVTMIVFLYFGYLIANRIAKNKAQKLLVDLSYYKETNYYQVDINLMYALAIIIVNFVFYIICKIFPYIDNMLVISVQSYSILSSLFVILYNGKRGYNARWFRIFSYLFYPLHIIIIFGFALLF